MAKNQVTRLEALVAMKSTLIAALQDDLKTAKRIVRRLRDENVELRKQIVQYEQRWYEMQDADTKWIAKMLEEESNGALSTKVFGDVIEIGRKRSEDIK